MSQTKNSKLESKFKNKMLKTSWVLRKKDVLLTSEKIWQQKGPGSICVGIAGRTLWSAIHVSHGLALGYFASLRDPLQSRSVTRWDKYISFFNPMYKNEVAENNYFWENIIVTKLNF
jgi:hypothetical protein